MSSTSLTWACPRFGKKPSFEEALQRPYNWLKIRRRIKAATVALFAVFMVFCALADDPATSANSHDAKFIDIALTTTALVLFVIGSSGWFFFWRFPDRILILRPFGEAKLSSSVRRFSKRHLSIRGFTVTLADRYLKDPIFLRMLSAVPTSWGELAVYFHRPLYRHARRYIIIRKAADLYELCERISGKFALGRFSAVTYGLGDGIQKVRSLDSHWKDTVDMLLKNCQVIVVDLSVIKEGSRWELERIHDLNLKWKTVFVVDEISSVRAEREIAQLWGVVPSITVHQYRSDDGKLLNEQAFHVEYAHRVSDIHHPELPRRKISRKALIAAVLTFVLNLYFAPFGIILGALALRDIRKNPNQLRGRILAHFVIMANVLLACVDVVFLSSLFKN